MTGTATAQTDLRSNWPWQS